MRIAWFDCFSGVSGDMCLGALVDAGASLPALRRELRRMPMDGYSLSARKVMRSGVEGTKVDVRVRAGSQACPARKWRDVRAIIGKSTLSPEVKDAGLRIFRLLFEAEGRVHGRAYDRVHLHELGAVDALVDVVGTLILLEGLGVGRVLSSALNVGGGSVRTEHGLLPVPAPATAALLEGLPAYASAPPDFDAELTTPTGAAILKGIAAKFGPMPSMVVERVGYGAGGRESLGEGAMPNLLRVAIGREGGREEESPTDVYVIEAAIDDMEPRVAAHAVGRLLEAGALDAYLTPVVMKKGRPGVVLTALTSPERLGLVEDTIFRETTTIGIRKWRAGRTVLSRRTVTKTTPYGPIRMKEVVLPGGETRASAEYEDCARAAREHGVPLGTVLAALRPEGRRH